MATKIRQAYYPDLRFGQKDPTEIELFYFNWTSRLASGENITSATVSATVFSGVDPNPGALISGGVTIAGPVVKQTIQGGLNGVVYLLTCNISTNLNNVYPDMVVKLPVVNG